MTRRLRALPPESRHLDATSLRIRQEELTARKQNAAVVARKHVLAVAQKIRREVKETGAAR